MDVFLLNPSSESARGTNRATIYPPLGLLYIGSTIKSTHKVRIIDFNALGMDQKFLLKEIYEHKPDIIGISANVVTSGAAITLAKQIKEKFKEILLVTGGPMPTVTPETFLESFDIVVRNEGEETFRRVLENEPLEKIDGISFKKEGKIIHNNPAKLISDLNGLPFPDYSLLEPSLKNYRSRARAMPSAPIMTSRGCPYLCTYCNKNIFGHKFRARSPENVIQEIEYLINEYGIKQIDILDDNFTLDMKRAEEILDLIIYKKFNIFINLQNGICANRVNRQLIRKMKKAGVYKVGIGVESGNQKILENVKKNVDLKNVKEVIGDFKKEGIIVYGFFMLGLPGDTPETMLDTINFAIDANPHIADFSITVPFPGTELYEWVKKYGRFITEPSIGYEMGFFGGKAFYETEKTLAMDVEKYFVRAYRTFYFRPSKIYELITTIKSFNELKWTIRSILDVFLDRRF